VSDLKDEEPVNGVIFSPCGLNSQPFTACCNRAICDVEERCSKCGTPIVGWDADTDHETYMMRRRR